MSLDNLLTALWSDYAERNPQAKQIHSLLEEQGETIINDHIAFRTFDHATINIDALAKFFLDKGYQPKDEYHFEQKKLFARYYSHEDMSKPKIFISHLLTDNFSQHAQKIIHNCIDQIENDLIEDNSFLYSGTPWQEKSYLHYQELLAESEYAAWLYAFGFCANHFTIFVNNLNHYNSIEKINTFIKDSGFKLNAAGGEIKGGPEEYLAQSSTLAAPVKVEFSEGVEEIPGCYYEFAQRFMMDNGQYYQGFVAASADKIFESTDRQ